MKLVNKTEVLDIVSKMDVCMKGQNAAVLMIDELQTYQDMISTDQMIEAINQEQKKKMESMPDDPEHRGDVIMWLGIYDYFRAIVREQLKENNK